MMPTRHAAGVVLKMLKNILKLYFTNTNITNLLPIAYNLHAHNLSLCII